MINSVYITAENMIKEIITDLATNQNFMKYLCYDDIKTDPLTKDNISHPSDYIFNASKYNPSDKTTLEQFRIFQTYIPFVEEKVKSFVVLGLQETEVLDNNPFYKKYIIYFDIQTHVDINVMTGSKIRLLRMMDLIHEQFNDKYTSNSIQEIFPLRDSPIRYGNNYIGYRLPYRLSSFSSKNAIHK